MRSRSDYIFRPFDNISCPTGQQFAILLRAEANEMPLSSIVLVWGQMPRPLRPICDSSPTTRTEYENAKNCIAEWVESEKIATEKIEQLTDSIRFVPVRPTQVIQRETELHFSPFFSLEVPQRIWWRTANIIILPGPGMPSATSCVSVCF